LRARGQHDLLGHPQQQAGPSGRGDRSRVEPQLPQPVRFWRHERRGREVRQDGPHRRDQLWRQRRPYPQVAILELNLALGQRLDQRPVGQAEGGAGGLGRHADGQRVAFGVSGDRLGELALQADPAGRVGEPVTRHGRRAAGNTHGGQRAGPQEAVAAQ
jgi:hypothetical protein